MLNFQQCRVYYPKKAVEPVRRGCAVILSAAVVTTASSKSRCRHDAMADPEG